MFQAVKGFKKEDLKYVAIEIGEDISGCNTISGFKDLILNSNEYKTDPEFVQELLVNVVAERKLQEQDQKEIEKLKIEAEKQKVEAEKQIELARIQSQNRGELPPSSYIVDLNNSKRKFTLPRLEFRQFGDDIKDWLPFWSQFEQIHKDEDIAPEDKFQYLIQATVSGSRAREVVESFPPNGANYVKAIESLKSRFGREDILVEVYVRELLKLIIYVQTKEKFSLTPLYDKLESYLRALETLGVTTDKCASILYPMVESCFPADFLKAWNRSNTSNTSTDAKERLNNLMQFLKKEVEGEERICLAVAGFGLGKVQEYKPVKKKQYSSDNLRNKVPTAMGLLTATTNKDMKKSCIFCDGKHLSSDCFAAQNMSLFERQKIVKDKRCCFACLSPSHPVKKCRTVLKCVICSKKHFPLMCERLDSQKMSVEKKEEKPVENDVNMSNFNKHSPKVFLQTVKAKLISDSKQKTVRLLFDSASHKSYILKSVAEEMNYTPLRSEKMAHSLFGGVVTNEFKHNCYKVKLRSLYEDFSCNFEVLDQSTICENIRPVFKGAWIKELEENEINLTDISDSCGNIDVLIGADIMGKMLTGKRKVLSSGLVAVETYLGWTLMGKVPQEQTSEENLAMTVLSLFVNESEISNLWKLDLIGINDPAEKKSKSEIDLQTKEHFLETVTINKEGRYEVCLPWSDDKSPLPDNLNLAKKRLDYTTSKLIGMNMYEKYENVLLDWLDAGIIEDVPKNEVSSYGNYLPHRAVIKLSSNTTPIRPVFDASARLANYPSLNQCLECGPNLMELIPDILLRFREKEFGVIADIRKAFLQISIRKEDRDFLRFLWWENMEERKLRVFRHARVVFGVKCSPFLLASVIEYHIKKCEGFEESFKKKLLKSFYVDNVVTSVDNKSQLDEFIANSKILMKKGGFDLREWEWSGDCDTDSRNETQVLGLIWNKDLDTLKINMKWLDDINMEKITKRNMLSTVHKVFDPFGFTSPVMLCPKIMLQKAWKLGTSWDEEITGELRKEFLQWFHELKYLADIQIPRSIHACSDDLSCYTIHTFVDGSKDAYAAVTFLRIEKTNRIELFLLAAKSRVAPLRGTTIPRMELLAAVIGARLANSVIEALGWRNVRMYYWSDSTTVLAWIMREENWSVFVRNRVQEIKKLSNPTSWRHVPGDKNPADLPSRGCKAKQLVSLKWWEGPHWIKNVLEFQNIMASSNFDWNEEEIEKEKSKTTYILANNEPSRVVNWYYRYFSNYDRIIRLVAWILRFKHNCTNVTKKEHGELTATEFQEAEMKVLLMIQNDYFLPEKENRLKTLQTFKDDRGIIRLKTKIIYRKDSEDFLRPIVLPPKHEVVKRLIYNAHVKNCHAGVQILMNILREKYWILNGRKAVKHVVANCTTCKRFSLKSIEVESPALPENRVKDAAVFQITGVDMAGPLFLKENKKGWILIFTCAVYRAVHFELVTAASTDGFLMAFRRFVARRGRCTTVYCDNGSNFVGAANYLKQLDWSLIQRSGAVNSIEWKFNPPTAAWWGGWWERLIRILKDLLKRVLGQARLNYEEMTTVLTDCERVINSRPLTYICEEEAIKPISPSMFLQDIHPCSLTDLDAVEQNFFCKRLKYRQTVLKDLRNRFRSEYLGALIQRKNKKSRKYSVTVGEIVIVGADNKKRIFWPLGRITKIIPGKDGQVRLVRVQTSQQELLRPIQRIYPLEITTSDNFSTPIVTDDLRESNVISKTLDCTSGDELKFTRSGRRIKETKRLNL